MHMLGFESMEMLCASRAENVLWAGEQIESNRAIECDSAQSALDYVTSPPPAAHIAQHRRIIKLDILYV